MFSHSAIYIDSSFSNRGEMWAFFYPCRTLDVIQLVEIHDRKDKCLCGALGLFSFAINDVPVYNSESR